MERKKIHLEYLLNATSKSILWAAISTPTGLEGWFADRVQSDDRIVTFFGEKQKNVMPRLLPCGRIHSFAFVGWMMGTGVNTLN